MLRHGLASQAKYGQAEQTLIRLEFSSLDDGFLADGVGYSHFSFLLKLASAYFSWSPIDIAIKATKLDAFVICSFFLW